MKFCAVICEYNPFHNGHAYLLERARAESGCEKVLCLMSGDFTQRGEAAVAEKYVRARHAVLGGADVVLELPAAFAVSPAELFARGAVHILSAIPAVAALAFGCESGTKEQFASLGAALSSENKAFKAALKENMKGGESYIRARNAAIAAFFPEIDGALLSSPNNILGGEYCHAIVSERSSIEPLPILRTGGGFADETLHDGFSSAAAIRAALEGDFRKNRKLLRKNVPQAVFEDFPVRAPESFQRAALCAVVSSPAAAVAAVPDCSEGLENRLKTLARSNPVYGDFVDKVTSKRYTRARIKRILAQNFLGVTLADVREFAQSPLYCNVLAVKKEGADETLSMLGGSKFPVLVRHSDEALLKKEAQACYRIDQNAAALYAVLSARNAAEPKAIFV